MLTPVRPRTLLGIGGCLLVAVGVAGCADTAAFETGDDRATASADATAAKAVPRTEKRLREILSRLQTAYDPLVAARGAKLDVEVRWDSDLLDASAGRLPAATPPRWIVTFHGGLFRHPKASADAMLWVGCHEMGHHLGGAPKRARSTAEQVTNATVWSSAEGAADYYATLKCLRHVLSADDNVAAVRALDVHPIVVSRCEAQFTAAADAALCKRAAMAGKSALDVIGKETHFERPIAGDGLRPNIQITGKPPAQCRLDTILAGALCKASLAAELDDDVVEGEGSCARGDVGARPLCWYYPAP